MKYSMKIMKMSELKRMGFSETFLLKAFADKKQTFAWRSNIHTNSPILFDTDGLEKYRLQQIALEKKYG